MPKIIARVACGKTNKQTIEHSIGEKKNRATMDGLFTIRLEGYCPVTAGLKCCIPLLLLPIRQDGEIVDQEWHKLPPASKIAKSKISKYIF